MEALMPVLRTFNVIPSLPPRLERLREIAYNLYWSWDPAARDLFARLDRDRWEAAGHNPIAVLATVSQERLEELSADDSFLAHVDRVGSKLEYYQRNGGWFADAYATLSAGPVAYFSMEFGLHGSVPLYSGGLGVLAGDHLKAASDLGVPLVGVGLLYRQGYFRQYLNKDGWQQETYPVIPPDELPVRLARAASGEPVRVDLAMGPRTVHCQVWQLIVGRVPLYLLDTDVQDNAPEDRTLTARLYGGDDTMRIQQEKILGVGGLRALAVMGVEPSVCHMNEGHSAFLGIEWIHRLMKAHGVGFDVAKQAVMSGGVFTTHTPVPAGNDEFPAALVSEYFGEYAQELGIAMKDFLALGQASGAPSTANFSMTLLALRLSSARNGVSRLHGKVSRRMWQRVWQDVPVEAVPIDSITNAVHLRTWLSGEYQELFDRYLGPEWATDSDNPAIWARIPKMPNTELWRAHERCRERLVDTARRRLRTQLLKRGAPAPEIERADEVLDPVALTIGFSRRFATYKRATLLFKDPDRLAAILNNKTCPVQIVFAGKAHPRDDAGKEYIRSIVHFAREERFHDRIVFIEDYEMSLSRCLVEGADVWLNTPRRPLEASGTSGMKAAVNGVLNLSELDGWWAEAYKPELGWAIGSGEEYNDPEYQDKVESQALYDVLEQEIVPAFYDRGKDGLPRAWIERMKVCIAELSPRFTMNRMVKEYAERFYVPASRRFAELTSDSMRRAAGLSDWLGRVRGAWEKVSVEQVEAERDQDHPVGSELRVRSIISLGSLAPGDVTVQLYYGRVGSEGRILQGRTREMNFADSGSNGASLYVGAIPCDESGRHAFAIQILPTHPDLAGRYETNLIRWG
jgi:starch phosphorylase